MCNIYLLLFLLGRCGRLNNASTAQATEATVSDIFLIINLDQIRLQSIRVYSTYIMFLSNHCFNSSCGDEFFWLQNAVSTDGGGAKKKG